MLFVRLEQVVKREAPASVGLIGWPLGRSVGKVEGVGGRADSYS